MNPTDFDPNVTNLAFVEELFEAFLHNPSSVEPAWREYFERLSNSDPRAKDVRTSPSFKPGTIFRPSSGAAPTNGSPATNGSLGGKTLTAPGATALAALAAPTTTHKLDPAETNTLTKDGATTLSLQVMQDRVDQLIRSYRTRGHKIAQLDPLGRPRPPQKELNPDYYGFTEADLDRPFSTRTMTGPDVRTLRRILQRMHDTYCRSIGVQFMHIDSLQVRDWLQERMEGTGNRIELKRDEQMRVLECLTKGVLFEEFIHRRFTGAKRFSLEGGETLIPALDRAIELAGDQGIEEVVLAMAHRGRLNVLANIMGKHPRAIFREFADADAQALRGRGDVKYHLGYSSDRITVTGKKIHLSLCFNPSHLEFVNPVALGRIRAKQDRVRDAFRNQGMVVLIHGDAAFAGEGVIQETFNLSQLQAYETGGTLHVIVNNQIGFTTPPQQGRSCSYATDVAKMLQIPIFHVNGEDPEAVAQVVKLAMEFRREFKRDVVIDLYCYRKYGHNEGDDASFTQPTMVRDIESRRSVNENYLDRLLEMGGISRAEADEMSERLRKEYAAELDLSKGEDFKPFPENTVSYWKNYKGGHDAAVPEVQTGLPLETLSHTLKKLAETPEWFHVHPKLQKVLENRRAMADGTLPVDWAAGEALAFGTLAVGGTRIRFSGQDVERGTFSHRHAVLHDYNDGRPYMPLKNLSPDQAPVEIANSPLSEIAVLGFEYGYSLDYPDGLVIWEAQFGDFVNVAQVIIDQFISSAEDKWRRLSGVVMLLPHGFEGNGPEHSSARLERFLTLAAEDNMQICNVTTPAQYFHMLRRQVVRPLRKPLIVMTPKSLLRHKKVVSSLSDLADGEFKRILPDNDPQRTDVDRVLLCSGKIYYDLEEHREKLGRHDVAILRVEQLYPLSDETIEEALKPYAVGTPVVWVQEEPENMGAWRHFRARFGDTIIERYPFAGVYREASASPATGSHKAHELEQHDLLDQAFAKALVPAPAQG